MAGLTLVIHSKPFCVSAPKPWAEAQCTELVPSLCILKKTNTVLLSFDRSRIQVWGQWAQAGHLWSGWRSHKPTVFFLCCPRILELTRTLMRTEPLGPELPTFINILAGGYVLRGNLPSSLDPSQKLCFWSGLESSKRHVLHAIGIAAKEKRSCFSSAVYFCSVYFCSTYCWWLCLGWYMGTVTPAEGGRVPSSPGWPRGGLRLFGRWNAGELDVHNSSFDMRLDIFYSFPRHTTWHDLKKNHWQEVHFLYCYLPQP